MCPMQDSKFGEKLKKIPVYSAINSSFRLSSAAEDKCFAPSTVAGYIRHYCYAF